MYLYIGIHVSAGTCTSTWRKRFTRIQQRQVETTRRASLKREYHYLTILLPGFNLSAHVHAHSVPSLTYCYSLRMPCRTRPLPGGATLFIEPQNLNVYFSDSSEIFGTARERLDVCFVPTALFPPSFIRQPAPKQSKTRDVGTRSEKLELSHARLVAHRRIQIFSPPNPRLSESVECALTRLISLAQSTMFSPPPPHFHLFLQYHQVHCLPNRVRLVFRHSRRYCCCSSFCSDYCVANSSPLPPTTLPFIYSDLLLLGPAFCCDNSRRFGNQYGEGQADSLVATRNGWDPYQCPRIQGSCGHNR